jgi:hypothetical protein
MQPDLVLAYLEQIQPTAVTHCSTVVCTKGLSSSSTNFDEEEERTPKLSEKDLFLYGQGGSMHGNFQKDKATVIVNLLPLPLQRDEKKAKEIERFAPVFMLLIVFRQLFSHAFILSLARPFVAYLPLPPG